MYKLYVREENGAGAGRRTLILQKGIYIVEEKQMKSFNLNLLEANIERISSKEALKGVIPIELNNLVLSGIK